jgi:hypothetical protein
MVTILISEFYEIPVRRETTRAMSRERLGKNGGEYAGRCMRGTLVVFMEDLFSDSGKVYITSRNPRSICIRPGPGLTVGSAEGIMWGNRL